MCEACRLDHDVSMGGLRANAQVSLTTRDKDPTLSGPIIRRMCTDSDNRFRELAQLIRQAIVDLDVFGLKSKGEKGQRDSDVQVNRDSQETKNRKGRYSLPKREAWSQRRTPQKVRLFMKWLRDQEAKGVLEQKRGAPKDVNGSRLWANLYLESNYRRGIQETYSQVKRTANRNKEIRDGLGRRWRQPVADFADSAFNQPIHADRVGMLYTRAFTDLEGITSTMDAQVSDVLSQGLIDGRNGEDLAREVINRVTGLTSTEGQRRRGISAMQRARTLARTELILAHQQAALNTMTEASNKLGEQVYAQWKTALDDRVRPAHQERHDKVFDRVEVESLLGEPNCRCGVVAYFPTIQGEVEISDPQDFL